MLDTRFGAALTLAMPFVLFMLCVHVFYGVNTYKIESLVPTSPGSVNVSSSSSNKFGKIILRVEAAASKRVLGMDDNCGSVLLHTEELSPQMRCKGVMEDVSPLSVSDDVVVCSSLVECHLLDNIAGEQDVVLSLPTAFQVFDWSVVPGKTWHMTRTRFNQTVRASVASAVSTASGGEGEGASILSGTKETPTLVKFGLLKSKLMDETESRVAGIEDGTTQYGIQLTWSETRREESATGSRSGRHFVSFRFAVSPFEFHVIVRNLKDTTTMFISVMTLFLSVMSAMRTVKTFAEHFIDEALVWQAKEKGGDVPADVVRRRRVLEEHVITGGKKGPRRMSSAVNVFATGESAKVSGSGERKRMGSPFDLFEMSVNPMYGCGEDNTCIELESVGEIACKGGSPINSRCLRLIAELEAKMQAKIQLLESEIVLLKSQIAHE